MIEPAQQPIPAPQDRVAEPPPPSIFSCKHAGIGFFTVFFKLVAVLFYLLGTLLFDSFVLTFIVVVVLSASDFWTVKNISGRILVGLRWWNDVDEQGRTTWHFESAADRTRFDPIDSKVFWWSLYLTPIFWLLLAIIAVLKFNFGWLLIVLVALSLSSANTYGYMQCDKDAKKRIGQLSRMAQVGQMLL